MKKESGVDVATEGHPMLCPSCHHGTLVQKGNILKCNNPACLYKTQGFEPCVFPPQIPSLELYPHSPPTQPHDPTKVSWQADQ